MVGALGGGPQGGLVVVGGGGGSASLRALAGPNVTFTGYLPRQDYVRTVAEARALVFAGYENFKHFACGGACLRDAPIAFARGGANEIIRRLGISEEPTGVLFERQTASATKEAVEHFELHCKAIAPSACRQNAMRFSSDRFKSEVQAAFERTLMIHASIFPLRCNASSQGRRPRSCRYSHSHRQILGLMRSALCGPLPFNFFDVD